MVSRIGLIALAVAFFLCLVLAGALWWQSGTVDTLRGDNARLTRAAETLAGQRDQILHSEKLAHQNTLRHAETAASLRLRLDAYEKGDCDATDPACAVRYINDILRSRED